MEFQPHHALGNFNLLEDEEENFDSQLLHHSGEQWLTFRLGDEIYGLEILQIRELISYPENVTRIPRQPDFLVGMINLRGMVLPVMDLRKRFGMTEVECNPFTVIVIVQISSKVIGVIVDSVVDVVNLDRENLLQTPEESTGVDSRFVHGLANLRGEMVVLLNLEQLLAPEELKQLGLPNQQHDVRDVG